MKKIVLSSIVCVMTLALYAQSTTPRFSFSKDTIALQLSKSNQNTVFKIYQGTLEQLYHAKTKHPILGEYINTPQKLIFIPLVPLRSNSAYTIVYNEQLYPFLLEIPENHTPITVNNIYPPSTTLPANFLKWYIEFSKPVNISNLYDHIRLLDSENSPIDRAVLPLENPLLSEDQKTLTLWIEPGRQKRDLGPNKRLGSVLTVGKTYTLVIDKLLKDQDGIPMQKDWRHTFTVTADDRKKPSLTSWKIKTPQPETKEGLTLIFDEVLDYGSLQNAIHILTASQTKVAGHFIVSKQQKGIIFFPEKNWKKGDYIILCKPILEDISGNNLERLFDQDLHEKRESPLLKRTFTITP